ncbi:MAG: UDP-glucose 6-dehydrogenase [Alphaproteobacteria bacterium MarineAlpha8_Bin1]|nr:MAG: UDP-glucose 6-dehydrogenase [Alphaproteobacteria bacterium MarineAlpha8_Bin1]
MKITIIGTGYVGLVTGTCFAEFGVQVTCIDKDVKKIKNLQKGIIPIYEPGLKDLVRKNIKEKRLSFDTELKNSINDASAIFIAVGTPSRRGDGHADLKYVYAAADEIAEYLDNYSVIVNKSTVPIGTGRKVFDIIKKKKPKNKFDVASNPEFLREGSAINDFMRPDRVVIGCNSEKAKSILKELYRPLYLLETPILFTKTETAELIKYAANSFLATKITFINEISDLCEKVGANVNDVSIGIGLDGRIGKKFLHPGPGYGGSCFPKDTLALVRTAQDYKSPLNLVEHVVKSNSKRKKDIFKKILKALRKIKKPYTITILGLTFKPNTDDMRDSPSLDVIPALLKNNCKLKVFDPEGMEEAKKILGKFSRKIEWSKDSYTACNGSDAVVILTEWNQFRALDLKKIKKILKNPILIDLRNIYKPDEMLKIGLQYHSIGRP